MMLKMFGLGQNISSPMRSHGLSFSLVNHAVMIRIRRRESWARVVM